MECLLGKFCVITGRFSSGGKCLFEDSLQPIVLACQSSDPGKTGNLLASRGCHIWDLSLALWGQLSGTARPSGQAFAWHQVWLAGPWFSGEVLDQSRTVVEFGRSPRTNCLLCIFDLLQQCHLAKTHASICFWKVFRFSPKRTHTPPRKFGHIRKA